MLSGHAGALRDRVSRRDLKADDPSFVEAAMKLDQERFRSAPDVSSPEWGHPITAPLTSRLIFSPGCLDGLTLFVLTAWYDAQEPYTTVWTQRLEQLASWIMDPARSQDTLPRARFPDIKQPIAWATWERSGPGGFGSWFATAINSIAKENPAGRGNVWRFVSRLALEFMNPSRDHSGALTKLLSGQFAALRLKRCWMLTMFLRRDQGIIRCLVERSLSRVSGGPDACAMWYDDALFPETEVGLPVDSRMLRIGSELFRMTSPDDKGIMCAAQDWADRHRLPASTLDALFFAMD